MLRIFQDIQNPTFITVNLRQTFKHVCALNYTRVSTNCTFFCPDERQWHRAMFRVLAGFIPSRGDARIARCTKNGVVQLKTILGALSFRDRSHDCCRALHTCDSFLSNSTSVYIIVSTVIIMHRSRATAAASNSVTLPY